MKEADGSGSGREPGAAEGARVRREDPARTRPLRSWWGMFRPGERSGAAGGRAPGSSNGSDGWSDVVNRAVEMGYRVIDEQIRQGQRAASEFSRQSYGPQSVNRDLQELFVRSMRYYADMAALWMGFLGTLPASLGAVTNPFGAAAGRAAGAGANGGGGSAAGPAGQRPAAAPEKAVSIQLTRPATVTLDLQPDAYRRTLVVSALHAKEDGLPALSEVRFEPASEIAAAVLRIAIPDDQPPGLYSGVVFDERSQVRGTVIVRIEG